MLDDDDERAPAAEPTPAVPAPEVEDNEAAEADADLQERDEGDDEAAAEATEDQGEPPAKRTEREKRAERYQRQIERLRAENDALRARTTGLRPEDVERQVERIVGKPPKQEDFGSDYLGFERAVTAYELDKRQTRREVEKQVHHQETARQAKQREAAEAHQERIEQLREVIPNFDAIMKDAADIKVSPAVEDLILESDQSAQLVLYLARNPETANDLNEMSPTQAARTIGRIESRLSLPSQRTQTRAPAPLRPLTGGAAPPSPQRDLDAYIKRKYGNRG